MNRTVDDVERDAEEGENGKRLDEFHADACDNAPDGRLVDADATPGKMTELTARNSKSTAVDFTRVSSESRASRAPALPLCMGDSLPLCLSGNDNSAGLVTDAQRGKRLCQHVGLCHGVRFPTLV